MINNNITKKMNEMVEILEGKTVVINIETDFFTVNRTIENIEINERNFDLVFLDSNNDEITINYELITKIEHDTIANLFIIYNDFGKVLITYV